MSIKSLFVILSIIFLTACHSDKNGKNAVDNSNGCNESSEVVVGGSIGCGIQSFSSPIEMAALVQDEGVPFSLEYLNPTDYSTNCKTEFKKVFRLGLFNSDLGYLNIYEKTSTAENYITVINSLTHELGLGQFWNVLALKRYVSNNNSDSLLSLSVHCLNALDSYWNGHDKSDLSYLLNSGVWLEGLYLATQVVKQKRDKKIEERIGEQRTVLEELIVRLRQFKGKKNFPDIVSEFEKLGKAFKGIEISYDFCEPSKKNVDDTIIIVTTAKMRKGQLEQIIKVTEEVRNKLIGL